MADEVELAVGVAAGGTGHQQTQFVGLMLALLQHRFHHL
jgi:hypothetical protein